MKADHNNRQTQSVTPSNDAARAGSILSGLADGIKGSQFPGAESVSSILNGLGGGLSNSQNSRNGAVDINSLVQSIEKRQTAAASPPPPTTADMQRASSIISGLADGLKGSTIPGASSIASILSGLGGGLGNGAKTTTVTKRQAQPAQPAQPAHPAHPPPTAADMERASSILKGVSDGLNKAFPGSTSVASILNGLSGGIKEGAKNAPANSVAAPGAAPKTDGGMAGMKRQGSVLPPPGTPEARKSAGDILTGLAKGIDNSALPLNNGVAGILNAVGGGLQAAAALPAAPSVAGRPT